jgi:hypothetical protein
MFPRLETLTLENVELDREATISILLLSIDLSIANATFYDGSFDYFKASFENKLRSVKYTDFLIVEVQTDDGEREDGRVWVVGGKMQAVAAMAEYDKYVGDPVLPN